MALLWPAYPTLHNAIALLRAREQRREGLEVLVDDPFRPGGKHLRGEWIPGKQVRQYERKELSQRRR